ncbi:hypothetical protein QAD02_012842 [Eretmocerus hayati]|uniref:Uncharacterized protein n=1 Tax=Eretmocerus hayati TaxID=131215 RepID=A0ACC2P5L3_9HYME|nr:hypothetical protein QAD02_012842 [Eretmocerus hayati]
MLTQSDAKERKDSLRLPGNHQKYLEEGYSQSGLEEYCILNEARDIQIECTSLMDSLVKTHHEMFVELFKRSLRPKQHNAVHYGSSIRKGGPMSPINTIRYEANHEFFKTAADSTSSREGTGYTLSLKNRSNSSYHSNFPFLTEDSHQCNWVKFRGLQYNPGTCVVVELDKDDAPIFGCIDSIFIDKDKHVWDLHAYQVDWSSIRELIDKIDNSFSSFPMIIHKM